MQSEIKAIIFDFDGVILDSVDIKTKAFERLFEPFGRQIQDKVVKYHLDNGGISRFDKINFFYREYLNRPITNKELDEKCLEFSSLVLDGVLNANWIHGAKEFIIRYNKFYEFFVASATPEPELKKIIHSKEIENYFVGTYGYPPVKKDIVKRIIEQFSYKPKELLYFGDSMQDFEAANSVSVKFIAINPAVKFGKDIISFKNFRPLLGNFEEMIYKQVTEKVT